MRDTARDASLLTDTPAPQRPTPNSQHSQHEREPARGAGDAVDAHHDALHRPTPRKQRQHLRPRRVGEGDGGGGDSKSSVRQWSHLCIGGDVRQVAHVHGAAVERRKRAGLVRRRPARGRREIACAKHTTPHPTPTRSPRHTQGHSTSLEVHVERPRGGRKVLDQRRHRASPSTAPSRDSGVKECRDGPAGAQSRRGARGGRSRVTSSEPCWTGAQSVAASLAVAQKGSISRGSAIWRAGPQTRRPGSRTPRM